MSATVRIVHWEYFTLDEVNLSPLKRVERGLYGRPCLPASEAEHSVSFAFLLTSAIGWTELSHEALKQLKAHIRTAAYITAVTKNHNAGGHGRVDRESVDLAQVPCTISWLNEHLYTYPASFYGLSKGGFTNTITGLRRILRHVGLLTDEDQALLPGGPWAAILQAIQSQKFCVIALTRFARWCQSQGIDPPAVSREVLVRYEGYVRSHQLRPDIPGLTASIGKAWRLAGRLLPDWPVTPIPAASRPQNYTLPFNAYPESLQRDVDAFAARLAGGGRRGPFRGDSPRKALRPASIKIRLYSLRLAAWALVSTGRDPSTILTLGELVEETTFESILWTVWEHSLERSKQKQAKGGIEPTKEPTGITSQTGGVATVLMIIAKYHCKLDRDVIDRMRSKAADLTPGRQSELSQKNRDRLRQLEDPLTREKLLHLPEQLMQDAESMLFSPKTGVTQRYEAARIARVAVAIEILLLIPLRVSNLAKLRLGQHLKYSDTRSRRITYLSLQAFEIKTDRDITWSVAEETNALIQRYLRFFQPILAGTGSEFLFPAGFEKEGPLSRESMASTIKKTLADELAVIINPHLFRCFVAQLILRNNPGALEDVRQMLGDKTLSIVLAHYAALQPIEAANRYSELIRKLRRQTPDIPTSPSTVVKGRKK